MIKDFKDSATEQLFLRQPTKKIPYPIQRSALRKLLMLHAAVDVRDLFIPPGNRLEMLRGDRQGQYSIRINQQWRVCFHWEAGHAYNVEITDYH